MFEVRQTLVFEEWLDNLKDVRASEQIARRITRLEYGQFGDVKPIGEGLSELRIDIGPGYRVYFTQKGRALIMLICGGAKKTQKRDIERAKQLAKMLET
jgi:putative addiction module killer protein